MRRWRTLRAEGPEAIIVGLANGGEARFAEYTPYASNDRPARGAGQGRATIDFLVETVKPPVDRSFPTRTERAATAIAGSSLGGLMSLYAGWQRPEVFGGIGAFSPAFPPGQAELVKRIAGGASRDVSTGW